MIEPNEEGEARVAASALRPGVPLALDVPLGPEEVSDQPIRVSLRAGGKTHELAPAVLDRDTGKARVLLDPSLLKPGPNMVAIGVAQQSWNPNRRVIVNVTAD